MAEYTPNYNLYKPNRNDADVEVDTSLSSNFTKIDTAIEGRANDISTLKTAFEAKHNTNGTFKGIADADISNTAGIKANKLAIQKLYKKTISPAVSATINTYGTAVELTTFTGFSSLAPLRISGITTAPVEGEVITLSVTATFNDTSTTEVVKTLEQSFSLTDNEFFALFKDNLYMTRLTFKVKSSIASSRVTVTVNHTGFYL